MVEQGTRYEPSVDAGGSAGAGVSDGADGLAVATAPPRASSEAAICLLGAFFAASAPSLAKNLLVSLAARAYPSASRRRILR